MNAATDFIFIGLIRLLPLVYWLQPLDEKELERKLKKDQKVLTWIIPEASRYFEADAASSKPPFLMVSVPSFSKGLYQEGTFALTHYVAVQLADFTQ